jgi:pimeloyl-ACP methyl ester carboxylesterase
MLVAPSLALNRRRLIAAGVLGAAALAASPSRAGSTTRSAAPVVLVHGGWRGGWSCRRVADRLAAAGHPVWAPSLTGLGDRSHLAGPSVTLSTHVADIVNLIAWEDLEGVILCGHSYGGMVITGVAEALAERIRAIVYLDAFLPEAGRSLLDALPDAMRARFLEAAAGDGMVPPPPAAAFMINPADRAWVDARCTPQPLGTFTEALPAVGRRETIARKIYVRATVYDSPAFRPFAARVAADPAWRLIEMAAGHDLMIDEPDKVAALLLEAAARSSVGLGSFAEPELH